MPRVTSVVAAGHRQGVGDDRRVIDAVIMDFAQRSAPSASVVSVKGKALDIDLHSPSRLHTDDLLVLDDGSLVEVVAAPEPLIEVRAADHAALMRLAWHLGDRHLPVQVLPNRVRVRRTGEIEELLKSLGARAMAIEAPFEPEGGAYEGAHVHRSGHDHDHDRIHGPAHDHAHGHHPDHD